MQNQGTARLQRRGNQTRQSNFKSGYSDGGDSQSNRGPMVTKVKEQLYVIGARRYHTRGDRNPCDAVTKPRKRTRLKSTKVQVDTMKSGQFLPNGLLFRRLEGQA
mmetsp:Transcript_23864/g.60271  ORF Transcript_23864/g.60271 Transcript_23864/m.60271 type:complete len:105 (+) Transcript_23864:2549-2863(+)